MDPLLFSLFPTVFVCNSRLTPKGALKTHSGLICQKSLKKSLRRRFQILNSGTITWYVEARSAGECFDRKVVVLPEGVSVRDLNAVMAFLGDAELDIFIRYEQSNGQTFQEKWRSDSPQLLTRIYIHVCQTQIGENARCIVYAQAFGQNCYWNIKAIVCFSGLDIPINLAISNNLKA